MIIEVIRGLNMGGAETLLYTRLRYATMHAPKGFARTVVVNTLASNDYYTEAIRDLGIDVVNLRNSDPVLGLIELHKLLNGMPDGATVIFHSPVTTYFEKFIRRLRVRPRSRVFIDVVHSTWYRGVYRFLGRLLDRGTDLAIAVSDDVATSPTARHYTKLQVILAGVDVERMRDWVASEPGAPTSLKQAVGIDDKPRLIVAVGSLIPLKGHRYIVEALARTELANVELAIVGEGSERSSLERLAAELGVWDRVHLLGRVDDGWRWTAIADAIIHPSHFEGLPVAMMEAAALGTPIVATDVGGLGHIVVNDDVGRLLPSQDPNLIAQALQGVLDRTGPISEVFPARGTKPTFWSMERYAEEFYGACATTGGR